MKYSIFSTVLLAGIFMSPSSKALEPECNVRGLTYLSKAAWIQGTAARANAQELSSSWHTTVTSITRSMIRNGDSIYSQNTYYYGSGLSDRTIVLLHEFVLEGADKNQMQDLFVCDPSGHKIAQQTFACTEKSCSVGFSIESDPSQAYQILGLAAGGYNLVAQYADGSRRRLTFTARSSLY